MWSEYFHDAVTRQKMSILLHNALDEGLESLELRLSYISIRRKLAVNISNYAKYKLTQKFLCSPGSDHLRSHSCLNSLFVFV